MGALITLYTGKESNKWLMVRTGQQIHAAWDPKSTFFSQTRCRPKTALNLGLSWVYNNFRWMIMLFFVCWMWKQSGLNLNSKGERMLEWSKLSGFWIVKQPPPHFLQHERRMPAFVWSVLNSRGTWPLWVNSKLQLPEMWHCKNPEFYGTKPHAQQQAST